MSRAIQLQERGPEEEYGGDHCYGRLNIENKRLEGGNGRRRWRHRRERSIEIRRQY